MLWQSPPQAAHVDRRTLQPRLSSHICETERQTQSMGCKLRQAFRKIFPNNCRSCENDVIECLWVLKTVWSKARITPYIQLQIVPGNAAKLVQTCPHEDKLPVDAPCLEAYRPGVCFASYRELHSQRSCRPMMTVFKAWPSKQSSIAVA